jgi:hypothetical protein
VRGFCALGLQRLQLEGMTNFRRPKAALRAAGLFVVMVGCGASVVSAQASTLPPNTTVADAMSGGAPALVIAPRGPSCIIGLNCGCIRGNCPGDHPHHHPAPANDNPPGGQVAPPPGGAGG